MLPVLATSRAVGSVVRTTFVRYLLAGGFFLAVATGAFFLFRKIILNRQRDAAIRDVGAGSADGLALGYASRLYAAMISGQQWWNDWFGDGTDEEAIFAVARDMNAARVPFALVSNKYKALYARDLFADLTAELSGEEMTQFQAALSTGLGNVLSPEPVVNQMLVTERQTEVLDEKLNPVGLAPARARLGAHDESMVLAGGRVLHGFLYHNQRRYVDAPAVRLASLN